MQTVVARKQVCRVLYSMHVKSRIVKAQTHGDDDDDDDDHGGDDENDDDN